ncbi:hypothetical protein HYH02_004502 [Chlamydomonas schloesseri]|uniref:Aquaporin n=1 Tax=Chlamydomonas schloesseri TaxID=2026947 RepID=A0A835WNL5_9CHLO|nr:hypothetical protein HYH02_004502 [Chlamydomonas schloesseri]|eukprot:KAG2450662.1 hypothetical protein HYH02_004502 [Chlamydomonas schloesseri]
MRSIRIPHPHVGLALRDKHFVTALLAEFLGVLLFQLLAGSIGHGPVETATCFAAIMYFVGPLSGGHLNPLVSLAGAATGHIDLVRGLCYAVVQILGAIMGAVLQVTQKLGAKGRVGVSVWLITDFSFGSPSDSCLAPPKHVSGPQLWGWEFLLSFLFLAVMYSCVFVAPGQGSAAPLAAGLALLAALSTGGFYTGGSPLNPARLFANMAVFRCDVAWGWTYLAAHLAAVGAAVAWVWPVHGLGMFMGGPRPDAFTGTSNTLGGSSLTDPFLAGTTGSSSGGGGGGPGGPTSGTAGGRIGAGMEPATAGGYV